jgi:uncharacterized protein YidB (DUF937 family)
MSANLALGQEQFVTCAKVPGLPDWRAATDGGVPLFEEEIMGFFDDAVHESVPGGDLAKPLMIAAGALILGHIFGGKHEAPAPAPDQGADPAAPQSSGGGFLGGALGNLAGSLGSSGIGGALGGALGGLASSPIGGALAGAAAGTAVSGGLGSLLNQFRNAGHGAAADSWVSDGANHPISADQINQVIGQGKIADLAQQAGVSPEQMSNLLAQALPTLISKLTPGGQLPQG